MSETHLANPKDLRIFSPFLMKNSTMNKKGIMLRAKLGENTEHNILMEKLADNVLFYFEILAKSD